MGFVWWPTPGLVQMERVDFEFFAAVAQRPEFRSVFSMRYPGIDSGPLNIQSPQILTIFIGFLNGTGSLEQ